MRVPDLCTLRHDGARVPLRSFAENGPVALVFLRHLGCIFCREQVALLRDRLSDENVVLVTMAEPRLADRYRRWLNSPHPFLCDPDREIYGVFGLERGSAGQMVSARTTRRALQALAHGHLPGRPVGDPWQLGGTFVMDGDGGVAAAFPAADAGDYPSVEALLRALREA